MTVDYTLSSVTDDGHGNIIYEIVLKSNLQRLHISVPRAHTDAATVDAIIDAAVAGLYAPPKPLH